MARTAIAGAVVTLIALHAPLAVAAPPGSGGSSNFSGIGGGSGAGGSDGAGTTFSGGTSANGQGGAGGQFISGGGSGGPVGLAVGSSMTLFGTMDGLGGGNGSYVGGASATGGGGGGDAIHVSGSGVVLTIDAKVIGGTGGNGGDAGFAGGGGGGGVGVSFASGGTLVNVGSIVGGTGGAGGNGVRSGGGGGGGHGVEGANLVIQNSGLIAGGAAGTGGYGDATAGAAVHFTGGKNTLELNAGSALGGAVWIDGAASATVLANTNNLSLSGALLVDGKGTIDTQSNLLTQAGSISGKGSLIKTGSGTLVLSGANTLAGTTSVQAGTLRAGAPGAFSASSATTVGSGATLDLDGTSQAVGSLAGAGTVALGSGTLTLGGDNTSTTFSGTIGGSGPSKVVKVGSGIFTLTGDATPAATTISAGTLQVGNGGTTGSLGGSIVNNATLAFQRSDDITVAGGIDGFGKVVQMGTGTLVLSGKNNYSGGTVVTSGVLQVGNDAQLGNASGGLTLDGGTLRASGTVTSMRSVAVGSGGGTIDLNGQLVAFGNTISGDGPLTIGTSSKGGSLGVLAANTYKGGTTLKDGVSVTLSGAGTLGSGDVTLQGTNTWLIVGMGANAGSNHYTVGRAGVGTDANNRISLMGPMSAQNARFTVNGTDWRPVNGPTNFLSFSGGATAADATIEAQGGTVSFSDLATGGNASIRVGDKALVHFIGTATAGAANITNEKGGTLRFADTVTADTATIVNQAGGQLDVSGMNPASLGIGSLSGAGRVALGATQLSLGALGRDDRIDGVVSELGSEFVQPGSGTGGGIVKVGQGTLTLSGANTYSGATKITAGTLRAGAVQTLPVASAVSVSPGATLDLAGFDQTLKSLSNAGTVSLVGAAAGTTLTVNGKYVGNDAVLKLGTALTATGPSDRLLLNGGSASGKTTIQVTQLGGLGAATSGDGIEVIAARNGATTTAQTTRDAFALAGGHVDAGAFEYRLYAADRQGAGESWFLRTEAPAAPPGAAPAPAPAPAPSPATTTYRAEAPLLAAAPAQMQVMDLAMFGTAATRYGDNDARSRPTASLLPVPGELSVDRRAWARAVYSDVDVRQAGPVSPSSKGHASGFQAGSDLFVGDLGLWRAGLFVGSLHGDVDVNGFASGLLRPVGSSTLSGRYLGAYATYTDPVGWYVDTTLQYGTQRYTSRSTNGLAAETKGKSLSAGVEVGRSFALGDSRWVLQPQAQLMVRRARFDDVAILGARVSQGDDTTWNALLGARIKGDFATSAGRLQPYGRVSLQYGHGGEQSTGFAGPAGFTELRSGANYTSVELAGGATLSLTRTLSLYGEIGRLFSAGGEMRVKANVQAAAGVRATW